MKRRIVQGLSEADLRNMRVFRAVATCGGLTRAEPALGMERTTISRHVKALEERLGAVLCQRGPRGFELTDFGAAVHAAAQALEDAIENARTEINGARKRIVGELRLGIADTCLTNPQARISEAVELFQDQAPEVDLNLSIHPPDRLATALTERRLHLGIVAESSVDPGRFVAQPIFEEAYRLYVCPEEGRGAPHISQLRSRGVGVVRRNFSSPGPALASMAIETDRVVHASGVEAVATLVSTGRYAGFLPTHFVDATRMRRPFVEVPGAEPLAAVSRFLVAAERGRAQTYAMQLMRETLVAVMQPSAKRPAGDLIDSDAQLDTKPT